MFAAARFDSTTDPTDSPPCSAPPRYNRSDVSASDSATNPRAPFVSGGCNWTWRLRPPEAVDTRPRCDGDGDD